MIFKNTEIHNCRELSYNNESGCFKMSRIPLELNDKIEGNAFQNSGVELRLVPIDDEVRIILKNCKDTAVRPIIYYGSIQSGWEELYKCVYSTPTEIVIKKAPNPEFLEKVTKENNFPFSPQVVRVILSNGVCEIKDVIGKCRPPKPEELPKKTYLAYGSSITHGSLAMVQPNTYAARIGEAFEADVVNLGFAGNARLEPEMAEYIASECKFDFATLEMGVNILDIECSDFEQRVRNFVPVIAKAHSDKPIFCTDVFYMHQDFNSGDGTCKAKEFRKIVKRVLEELSLPNVTYICGTDLLSGSHGLSQDEVHPNARGVEEIASGFIGRMKSVLADKN